MEKLNLEVFKVEPNYIDPIRVYLNLDNLDFIEAKFSWSGNKITGVEIHDSEQQREFKEIIYCPDLDALEFHCLVGKGISTNIGFNMSISNFIVDSIRVMIFEYEDPSKIKTCHKDYYQPDTKNGAIIVGG